MPAVNENGTFLLGMGVAKSGTTWLWQVLARSEYFTAGASKEMHHLNRAFDPGLSLKAPAGHQHANWTDSLESCNQKTKTHLREAFANRPQSYYDYFTQLLRESARPLVGDFTPLHSGLSRSALTSVKEAFANRGVEVLPLLILRDPVTRLNSHARHEIRKFQLDDSPSNELAIMKRMLNSKVERQRASYDRTLIRLTDVFQTFPVFLYEDIREDNDRALRKVEQALQVPEFSLQSIPPVNVNPTSSLRPSQLRPFSISYEDSYVAAFKHFGEDVIRRLWPYAP